MCTHSPECPPVDKPGWDTAALLIHHEDLGWSMLCNGAIVLDTAVRPALVTQIPAVRTRTLTRSRKATPATSRRPAAQPIAA